MNGNVNKQKQHKTALFLDAVENAWYIVLSLIERNVMIWVIAYAVLALLFWFLFWLHQQHNM